MTEFPPRPEELPSGMKRLIFFNIGLHAISALLLGAWLLYMYAPTGEIAGIDLLKVVLITGGVMAAQSAFTIMAIRFIPDLTGNSRGLLSSIVAIFMALIALFGGGASASMIGLPSAQKESQQQALIGMTNSVGHSKDVVDKVNDLIPTLRQCDVVVSDMLSRELAGGDVSRTGRNTGPVSAELSSIRLACHTAERALVASRSQTGELFADMDRLVANARRTVDEKEANDRDKLARLVRLNEELANLAKELPKVVPVQSLRPVADSLKKDREVLDLSPEAVAAIDLALRPIAKAIGADVEEIGEELLKPYPIIEPVTNPMEYLWLYPGVMIVPLVIAVLLEVTPLLVIVFCVVLSLQRRQMVRTGGPHTGGGKLRPIETARVAS